MRRGLLIPGLLAALSPSGGASAQELEIVVEGPTLQGEIERILAADNIDPANMTAREVADALARIPRGRAPDDFWDSYQRHVEAWRRFADAETDPTVDYRAFRATERAINATYAEAERIALDYGARPPRKQNRWRPPGQ
jgi:hypothetical protein